MAGLVLAAGGARGAYQAGVLQRIGEIPALRGRPSPFPIVTGASAGAINGAAVAAGSHDFHETTQRLSRLWADLRVQDVYRSDVVSLTSGGLRWLQDLSLGGVFGGGGAQSLLDATPLRAFLERQLPLPGIAESIRQGHLFALAISATCYYTGKSFTFVQGRPGHPVWTKARRVTLAVDIGIDHILASAAIPVIFAPVFIATPIGDFYFGDGALRLVTPFSPAIRLGADRVFAIGIRSQKSAEERSRSSLLESPEAEGSGRVMKKPPLAQIFGVFLNAIFLDHLDTDLDHLKRMNQLISSFGGGETCAPRDAERSASPDAPAEPMKIVQPFAIDPSEDLARVAESFENRMPRIVRFAMEGLGTSKAESADLLSYLLFDSSFTSALIDIGYRDASSQIDQIEAFLFDGDDDVEGASAGGAGDSMLA